jgi:ADP-ribosylation factor family.
MKLFGKLANILGIKKKEVKILILGLNNSGKSTIVNHLKSEEDKVLNIVPTVGLNVEKFKCKYSSYDLFICESTSMLS